MSHMQVAFFTIFTIFLRFSDSSQVRCPGSAQISVFFLCVLCSLPCWHGEGDLFLGQLRGSGDVPRAAWLNSCCVGTWSQFWGWEDVSVSSLAILLFFSSGGWWPPYPVENMLPSLVCFDSPMWLLFPHSFGVGGTSPTLCSDDSHLRFPPSTLDELVFCVFDISTFKASKHLRLNVFRTELLNFALSPTV